MKINILRKVLLVFILFTLPINVNAKTTIEKEAQLYYKKGLAINKSINEAQRINPHIDCSLMEKEAYDNFSKAIELNPKYSDAYYARAEKGYNHIRNFLVHNGHLFYPLRICGDSIQQIISDYEMVINLSPNKIKAYNKKIFLKLYQCVDYNDDKYDKTKYEILEAKHLDSIYDDINKVLSLNPINAEAYLYKGILFGFFYNGYDDQNNKVLFKEQEKMFLVSENEKQVYNYNKEIALQNAIKDISTSLSINPRNSLAYVYRAYFRSQMSDYQGGVEDLTSAINLEPSNAMYYYLRGNDKFYLKEDYKGAYKDFVRARNLSLSTNSELYSKTLDMVECLEKYHADKI